MAKRRNLLTILSAGLFASTLLVGCSEEPHVHAWSEWSQSVAATHSTVGEQTRICSCGDKETAPLPKLTEHVWGEWTVKTAATHTTEGKEERVCACGAKEERAISKLADHSYGEWREVLAATCEASGKEERVCACGAKEERATAAKGHYYKDGVVVTAPGFGTKGKITYECMRQGCTHVLTTWVESTKVVTESGATEWMAQPTKEGGKGVVSFKTNYGATLTVGDLILFDKGDSATCTEGGVHTWSTKGLKNTKTIMDTLKVTADEANEILDAIEYKVTEPTPATGHHLVDGTCTNKGCTYEVPLFKIDDVTSITGRGTVLMGKLLKGTLKVNDTLTYHGFSDSDIFSFIVTSIEKNRTLVDEAVAGDNIGIIARGKEKSDFEKHTYCYDAIPEAYTFGDTFDARLYVADTGFNSTYKIGSLFYLDYDGEYAVRAEVTAFKDGTSEEIPFGDSRVVEVTTLVPVLLFENFYYSYFISGKAYAWMIPANKTANSTFVPKVEISSINIMNTGSTTSTINKFAYKDANGNLFDDPMCTTPASDYVNYDFYFGVSAFTVGENTATVTFGSKNYCPVATNTLANKACVVKYSVPKEPGKLPREIQTSEGFVISSISDSGLTLTGTLPNNAYIMGVYAITEK